MGIRNLQQLRDQVPEALRSLSDEDLVDNYSRKVGIPYEKAADFFGVAPRGTLREMGRQLAGGAVVDLPKMIGQGLQYTELAPQYGKEMAQAAEARAPDYAPDLRDRGLAGKVGIYGARGVAPVLGTTALMFTPGGQVTAPVVAGALFGTSSAQETYDKILEQTGDPEAATAAARRVGLIQGVGEGAATLVGGRVLKGLAPGLGGGARTAGQVATGLTDTSIAKPFLKGMAINAAVQPATEVAQDLGSYAVEQAYGAKAEDPYAIAEQSALGGLGLTLLLGPLALGSHKSRSNRAAALKDALFSPDADPMVTAKARDLVMAEAKRQGIPDSNIDAWFNRQLTIEDQRNESLRQAELQERDKQINLMGEKAQGLEGLQGGMFSSLDQQRRFEQGLGAVEPSIQGPFGSLAQQQTFEEGLTATRDANIARVGGEFQDLMASRMAGQMAAEEPGQQWQALQARREQGLQTAQDVGAQWQEIKADKQRTQFDIEEMGRDWQKLQAELPQPVSTDLTSGQRAALRGPEGKRLKQTSSPLPARELPTATTLLPAEQAPSTSLLQQPAAPMSQLTDRPAEAAPVSPLVAQAAPLPPAPAAGGVSSTPATTTQDGAQTTQAKQTKAKKQKAPIAVGSVVKVNDKEITLSQEQADAWNKAQEAYDSRARRARELTNYQERESALRGAGMQLSAERRKITGALTAKEQQAANRVAARQTAEQRTQDDLGLTAALQTANRTNVANNPLQAGVQGVDKKPVPGKTSLTVNSLRNIRDALLNPSATVEGISDKEQQIADAVRAFAKSYYKFSNAGGNMLRGIPTERAIKGENGETIYKPTKLAGQTPAEQRGQIKAKTGIRVATTLDQLGQTRQALAGLGEAVGGNAKDVEAIVKLVKDMVQQKLHTEVNDEGMNEDFGQMDDGDDGVAQAFKKMDTMLSQGWRAAKDNMFQGVSDAAFVRQTPIRNSKEANAAASTAVTLDTPLEMAAQGYAKFGKGESATGILGVLNYIQTHGTPFERTIAKGVFQSLYDSDTAPKLEFITQGKPYYDPKTNTVYIQRDASAAVTLHESLHAALQWYVYQNPNAPEVRALKASLKRVVNFKGELSPDAQRVQDVLKTLVKDKKELDAVLELISYGNTLNDFRRALEAMDSTEAPKSFYDAAKNVWQAILTTVQKLVGVRPSVAADVIGNTFKLLEAAGSGKKGEAVGNRLESKISTLTDAFKNWFKDSKVVDNDGNPLVVYHGTVGDFSTFSRDLLGKSTMTESAKRGFFFGGNPETANAFARIANRFGDATLDPDTAESNFKTFVADTKAKLKEAEASKDPAKIDNAKKELAGVEAAYADFLGMRQNIMPVYLSMQNPLVVDQKGKSYRDQSYAATITKATRDGHDGVIIRNTYDGVQVPSVFDRIAAKLRGKNIPADTIYIVFEPNQIKSAIGNRGTYDPNSDNILEAAVESNKPVSDAKVAETLGVREQDYSRFNKSNAIQLQLTQRAFEVVGWNRANMEKLTGKAGDKMRAFISKNFPGTEILLGWINSRYNVSNTVSQTMDRYKLNKGIGYQYAEDLANVISRRPAEEVNALFAYLDGNKQALDKMPDSMKLKAVADKLDQWFKLYVAELTPVEQRYFNSRKFSETLLFPETTEQVAGNTFGLGKINEVLGLKRESETELDQDWFQKDDNGDLVTDGDVYRVFEANNLTAKGGMVPAGFISAARFAELNNVNPMGYVVDTSRKWLFEGVKDKKYSFVTNTTAKEKIANEKADDVANALRNTIAALANNYASKHFIKSVYNMGRGDNAHAQVAFDSLEEVNKAFGVNLRENQVLPISREISRSPQTKSLYRQSGTWVKLPDNSPAYGELSGKYIPGPVWNAMGDMSDRQPVIPWRAANNVMRWFKKSKTVWNFGTHMTNTASNVTMAMMHDISFSTMSTASKILAKYEASPKSLTKDELALMMAFRDSGAMLADYSSAEVKEALYKAHADNLRGGEDVSVMRRVAGWLNIEKSKAEWIKKQAAKVGKGINYVDEVSSQMYAAEDNIFRLAAFLKTAGALQTRAGLKAPTQEMMQEAGLFARKAFGDYDIDSKAVKIGRQTVLPFVSWVYAMAPVLGRIAVYEPWKLTNVLMAYMILEAAMGAAAGDDEEKRINGPESLRERLFGSMGPYTHVRIPFMGDDENPVYYKLGDYFPTSTFTRGLPNGLAGQSWVPASVSPSGPFVSAILGLVGGVDPYTGKSLHQPTDTEWQKLWTAAKFTYDTATIPLLSSKNIEKVNDLIDEKTGITGAEPSSLFIARAFGLKFYDYNEGEQAAINKTIEKRITNEFKTAINKAKREEYRKGYPDYEELDKTLEDLQVRMQEKLDKARGVEE